MSTRYRLVRSTVTSAFRTPKVQNNKISDRNISLPPPSFPIPPTPVIGTIADQDGYIGESFSLIPTITTEGVPPYTWTLESGTLPDGLTLDGYTGEISGTPTTIELQSGIQLRVTDTTPFFNLSNTFYIRIIVPPFIESFEYEDGWPGTIDLTPPSFTTPELTESFENAEGWPGT